MHQFTMSKLKPGSHVHMIGIGGISMSALAHMLIDFATASPAPTPRPQT